MAHSVGFYREIYRLIEQGLSAHGMHKHSKGVYSRKLSHDAIGILSLNTATKYGFSINPLIGVQYLPLEYLLAELKEWPWHPTKCGATVTRPIGYLAPPHRFREWYYEEGQDNVSAVADMVHQITTVGFRYMEENCTLEKVCARIVDRHFMLHNDVYHLPVGYLMLGRFDEAEKVVRDEMAKIAAHKRPTIEEHEAALGEKLSPEEIQDLLELKKQPIPAHERYLKFAERFLRRLEDERRRVE